MSKHDFRLVLNSTTGTGAVNQLTYNYDWRKHTQGWYQVTTTFCSSVVESATIVHPQCDIHIDFPTNTFSTYSNGTNASSTHFALAEPIEVDQNEAVIYCNPQSNEPIMMMRPFNSNFTVSIYNPYTGALWQDSANNPPQSYFLILGFRWVSEH